jgi:hypothetical protein
MALPSSGKGMARASPNKTSQTVSIRTRHKRRRDARYDAERRRRPAPRSGKSSYPSVRFPLTRGLCWGGGRASASPCPGRP